MQINESPRPRSTNFKFQILAACQGAQQNSFHAASHELPFQVGGCKGTIGPLIYLGSAA
jgi:hypothetical protein